MPSNLVQIASYTAALPILEFCTPTSRNTVVKWLHLCLKPLAVPELCKCMYASYMRCTYVMGKRAWKTRRLFASFNLPGLRRRQRPPLRTACLCCTSRQCPRTPHVWHPPGCRYVAPSTEVDPALDPLTPVVSNNWFKGAVLAPRTRMLACAEQQRSLPLQRTWFKLMQSVCAKSNAYIQRKLFTAVSHAGQSSIWGSGAITWSMKQESVGAFL